MVTSNRFTKVFGVMQAVGENQVGMAAAITQFAAKRGANIVTSQMLRHGRELFIITLTQSAPAADFERVEAELEELAEYNARVVRVPKPQAEVHTGGLYYELSVYAYDRRGLMAETAAVVASEGVDIMQLGSSTYPAPFDGEPLYLMEAILEAPNHMAAKRCHANLEALADLHGWDVYWRPVLKTGVMVDPLAVYPPLTSNRLSPPVVVAPKG